MKKRKLYKHRKKRKVSTEHREELIIRSLIIGLKKKKGIASTKNALEVWEEKYKRERYEFIFGKKMEDKPDGKDVPP